MRRNRGQNSAVISGSQPGRRQAHCDGTGVDAGRDLGPGKSGGENLRRRCHRAVQHRRDGARARHRRSDQLLIQSPEAINIIPNVRVFQNNRNAEARGAIIPVDTGAGATGLADMLSDTARQRLYIANPGRTGLRSST